MFVINFDFSQYHYHFKFILVNVPVILTQLITYPLQRVQTQLIIKPKEQYIIKNQFQQSHFILRDLIAKQGFPKFLQGVRYSMDFSVTQMTTKFFMFDWLMGIGQGKTTDKSNNSITQSYQSDQFKNKLTIYTKCIIANTFATLISQSAFNYQVLASSLPINPKNSNQIVKDQLIKYTKNRKNIPIIGLKYTIPVTIYNTVLEVFLIEKFNNLFYANSKNNNNGKISYYLQQLTTSFSTLVLTSFACHYAYLRQIQLIMNLKKQSLPYMKGLFGTLVRQVSKGMGLYGMYFIWFQHQSKKMLRQENIRRDHIQDPMQYRKGNQGLGGLTRI